MAATAEERVVRIGGYLAAGFSRRQWKARVFHDSFLGVPVHLCWEITNFEVTDKVVNVAIRITASRCWATVHDQDVSFSLLQSTELVLHRAG